MTIVVFGNVEFRLYRVPLPLRPSISLTSEPPFGSGAAPTFTKQFESIEYQKVIGFAPFPSPFVTNSLGR